MSVRRSALVAACVAATLIGGCGGSSGGSATSPTAGAGAGASVSVSGQQVINTAEAVIPRFCQAPSPSPTPAVGAAVAKLVALLQREPDAVVGGAVFPGKTVREVLGDFGGLLNTHCAPTLASRIAQALHGAG